MYKECDLRELVKYLEELIAQLEKEKDKETQIEEIRVLFMQLKAIRYNPLLFKDICKRYDVSYVMMDCPIKELPLHINDSGYLSQALIKWRLKNEK